MNGTVAGASAKGRVTRGIALAIAIVLAIGLLPGVAHADFLVNVRIEGQSATLWKSSVWSSTSHIVDTDGVDHVMTHKAMGTVDAAASLGAFTYSVRDFGWGLMVESINGETSNPNPPYPGWMYRVNGVAPSVGADQYGLKAGDSVLWYYGTWDASPTVAGVSSPAVAVNTTLTVTAKQLDMAGNASVLPEAIVHIGSAVATADAQGIVRKKMTRLGVYGVRVEKPDHVRSAIARVKVAYPSAIRNFAVGPRIVRRGAYVRITGRLVSRGAGLAGRRVKLQRKPVGTAAWRDFATVSTAAGGIFFARTRPGRSMHYRAVWYGDATHLGTVSPARRVLVRR